MSIVTISISRMGRQCSRCSRADGVSSFRRRKNPERGCESRWSPENTRAGHAKSRPSRHGSVSSTRTPSIARRKGIGPQGFAVGATQCDIRIKAQSEAWRAAALRRASPSGRGPNAKPPLSSARGELQENHDGASDLLRGFAVPAGEPQEYRDAFKARSAAAILSSDPNDRGAVASLGSEIQRSGSLTTP